jgi:hypothetical protein
VKKCIGSLIRYRSKVEVMAKALLGLKEVDLDARALVFHQE